MTADEWFINTKLVGVTLPLRVQERGDDVERAAKYNEVQITL